MIYIIFIAALNSGLSNYSYLIIALVPSTTLSKGISIEGIKYGPIKVEIDTEKDANSWLTISLTEGKNREIRKIMEHIGLQVNRLIRVSFGPFILGSMKSGEIVEVSKKALKASVPEII